MDTTKQIHTTLTEADAENKHQTTSNKQCMLTPTTTAAIAVLHCIASDGLSMPPSLPTPSAAIQQLIHRLVVADIIRPVPPTEAGNLLSGYELTRSVQEISLLDILKAIDQHLDCNQETNENLYSRYRRAASNLGVINHMTRLYLSKIKLSDL